jgi:hypothetical protein
MRSYKHYKYFLAKWRREADELKRILFTVGLTETEKAYIKGQIQAIDAMCEVLIYTFRFT